jgi:hypothetical protein
MAWTATSCTNLACGTGEPGETGKPGKEWRVAAAAAGGAGSVVQRLYDN